MFDHVQKSCSAVVPICESYQQSKKIFSKYSELLYRNALTVFRMKTKR